MSIDPAPVVQPSVFTANTKEDIQRCFPVVTQLRPHLSEEAFISQVRRQIETHGYKLVFIEEKGMVKAVAGFRIAEYLAWGKILYVDDLITNGSDRGKGLGRALLVWLQNEAKVQHCVEIHLDSGFQRFDAHRLYIGNKMDIACHHFAKRIG